MANKSNVYTTKDLFANPLNAFSGKTFISSTNDENLSPEAKAAREAALAYAKKGYGGGGYSYAGGGKGASGSSQYFSNLTDSIIDSLKYSRPAGGGLENPLLTYNTDFTNSATYKALQQSLKELSAGANPIDLTKIIESYNRNNQATIDTLNKTLGDTINTLKSSNEQSRNDLLTSLKRFQESNAESMRMQQQDFNASRATLEDEAFMNQRNTMANASSRGLGGSGLQQLAQLQNRMAAGKDVSTLALKNQNVQDALRKALTQKQEDYDTNISNLETNLKNAIINAQNQTAAKVNEANANNTNLINQLIYNEQARQRSAAASAASAKANLNQMLYNMNEGVTRLQGAQNALNAELENKTSSYLSEKGKSSVSRLSNSQKKELSSELNTIYQNYITQVATNNLAADYGLDNSYTDTAIKNLKTIYDRYSL